MHPDDRNRLEREVGRVMLEGGRLDVVYRALLDDGSVRWVNELGHMWYDAERVPKGMYGVQIDVTDRVNVQQRLEELHRLMQAVTDQTPDWIFAKDTSHRFLFVNRAFAAAQGRVPADVTGRLDAEFWPPELCEGDPVRGTRGFHDDDREALAGRVVHNPKDAATVAGGEVRYSTP